MSKVDCRERTESNDNILKLLLVGDSGSGKSSLMLRYADNSFDVDGKSTLGAEFKQKEIEVDGEEYVLQIWDPAGQERFRTITASFYQGAHGIIITYDVTAPSTFANVRQWFNEIERYGSETAITILVATKCDKEEERKVEKNVAESFAKSLRLLYFESSSKDAIQVDEAFDKLVEEVIQSRMKEKGLINPADTKCVLPTKDATSPGCCATM